MWIQTAFTLNILIDVCLIFVTWKIYKKGYKVVVSHVHPTKKETVIAKDLAKYHVKAAIAEKFAERAFNMASTANLGVIALQKSLQAPKLLTKHQVTRNQLAKNDIDKLFTTEGTFDFLRPILSDEENELLDKIEQDKFKNGETL